MTFGVAHSLQELLLRFLSMNEGESGTSGILQRFPILAHHSLYIFRPPLLGISLVRLFLGVGMKMK